MAICPYNIYIIFFIYKIATLLLSLFAIVITVVATKMYIIVPFFLFSCITRPNTVSSLFDVILSNSKIQFRKIVVHRPIVTTYQYSVVLDRFEMILMWEERSE